MKNILLTLSLIHFASLAFATHNCCGYIKAKTTGDLQLEATIVTYTKVAAVAADRDSLQICWGDGVCEWISRDTSYIVSDELEIKYNSYTWQHTYATDGWYIVSMTDPNRTGGAINIMNSDNYPFHIQTRILVSNFPNETPEFLSDPLISGLVFEPLEWNLNLFDIDGDSLAYEAQVPLFGINEEVPNYSSPSSIIPTNNNYTINSSIGTISWNSPQLAGRYIIAIKIIEFRNGNVISETIYDCEIEIRSTSSQLNLLSDESIRIYPIPITEGHFNIEFPQGSFMRNEAIRIYSMDGKLLFEKSSQTDNPVQRIDIQGFTKGSYLLVIKNEESSYSKIIIKK